MKIYNAKFVLSEPMKKSIREAHRFFGVPLSAWSTKTTITKILSNFSSLVEENQQLKKELNRLRGGK